MRFPPPDYFDNIFLLGKLRAGDVPCCLARDVVEARLLNWIQLALGAN